MDIRQQRNRFIAFAFAGADLLIEVDEAGVVRFSMGAAQRLLGLGPNGLDGSSLSAHFEPGDATILSLALGRVHDGQRFGPLVLRTLGGGAVPRVAVQGCRMPSAPGSIFLAICEAKVDSMTQALLARRDSATGLLDRAGFEAAAEETLRLARDVGQDVALTLVTLPDLDAFTARAGEASAQSFLAEAGALLRSLALNDTSAQLSPGRFSVLRAAATPPPDIEGDLARLARSKDPTGQGLEVRQSDVAADKTLSEADCARALLYTVKHFAEDDEVIRGDNLSSMLDAMAAESTQRICRLRNGIERGLLDVVGQPIVDLATRRVKHLELLVRFQQGQSPLSDIIFAEKTGLIHDLDLAILRRALAYLKSPGSRTMSLAVNLSGQSVASPAFVQTLLPLLMQNRDLAPRLVFEITETSLIADLPAANRVAQQMRQLGFRVCLDDFGAGSASFQYLRHFEIDFIKIDGEYVRTALGAPREAAILKAMVALANDLSAGVIAEQIETPAQVQALRALGCAMGQGFLFGRPAPLPESDITPIEVIIPARQSGVKA